MERLPTVAWTLDRQYRAGVAARTRPRQPGALPFLSTLDPTTIRRADTAVVVASGPSAEHVTRLTRAQAADFDFYPLNHAAALPVPGRLYSIEVPVLKGRQAEMTPDEAVDLLLWALRRTDVFSGTVPLVVRGNWHSAPTRELATSMADRGAHVVVAPRFSIAVHGRRGPARYGRWAHRRRPFRWPAANEPVLSPRGGLGFLVSLCISLGYPRIVLAGVDLVSDAYFFDPWDDAELAALTRRMRPASDSPHLTAVAGGRRPATDALLASLDRYHLRPDGRRLLIGSEQSLLHPALELFRWPDDDA